MITGVIVDTGNVLTTGTVTMNTTSTGDTGTSIEVIGDLGMTGTTMQGIDRGTGMDDTIGKMDT